MGRLDDKVCIVTGASAGIGRATAVLFAQEGAKVVVTGRNEERAKAVVDKIKAEGGEAMYVIADTSDLEVLKDVSQVIRRGQKVVLLGPSGSGKTTFLRCLNLLEQPTGGKIWFEGKEITAPDCDINRVRARMCMVFQQFNLFPHLSIRKNITLAPVKLKLKSKEEADADAERLLARVGLREKIDACKGMIAKKTARNTEG